MKIHRSTLWLFTSFFGLLAALSGLALLFAPTSSAGFAYGPEAAEEISAALQAQGRPSTSAISVSSHALSVTLMYVRALSRRLDLVSQWLLCLLLLLLVSSVVLLIKGLRAEKEP